MNSVTPLSNPGLSCRVIIPIGSELATRGYENNWILGGLAVCQRCYEGIGYLPCSWKTPFSSNVCGYRRVSTINPWLAVFGMCKCNHMLACLNQNQLICKTSSCAELRIFSLGCALKVMLHPPRFIVAQRCAVACVWSGYSSTHDL